MINIAVLGYGTVGSGVVEVINTNQKHINKRAGKEINVKYVLDLREFPGDPVEKILVHDYSTILNDDDVKVVVEVMGGVEPANTFVRQALEKGKSVCTSNKELVAKHGAELLEIAKKNNVNFLFEASVGGGIPIIRPINQSLTVDHIDEISGILNGTTNYILTKMADEGLAFDTVLKQAQEMGYAERNPEADVCGYDACRKIAILTSLVYGKQVDYEDIYTEGITEITERDFVYAKAMNTSIKLLGRSINIDGTVYAMVAPFVIGADHCLIGVNGVYNGILLHGDMLDNVMFYGRGAGKLPTASAVVSDVVDAVKHRHTNIMTIWSKEKKVLGDINEFACGYFVRVKGAVSKDELEKVFGEVELVTVEDITDETAFLIKSMKEADFNEKIKSFELVNRIRTSLN